MLDDAGRWSHWSDPVQFTAGSPTGPLQDGLRVTEIMFNPPASPPGDAQADNDEFEFIELQNISNDVLDISGVRIEGGIEFEFPSAPLTTLAPREFIVVVRNQQTFETRYDASNFVIAGEFTNGLSNSSDTIRATSHLSLWQFAISFRRSFRCYSQKTRSRNEGRSPENIRSRIASGRRIGNGGGIGQQSGIDPRPARVDVVF